MDDGNKNDDTNNMSGEPENRTARLRSRLREWQIRQQAARGLAYGIGSGAVSLLVLWAQHRY
ncbi:hypothetical protein [Streptomyces sp. NPDC006335]|uniref:hypothetical protein n=1 Tax=Streptomyces sp. NPDC006335 TaxID=3156895 RepID=UPI0033BB5E80